MRAIHAVFFWVCIVVAFTGQAWAVSINIQDSVKLYNGPGGEDSQGSSKKLLGGELYMDLAPFKNSGGHDFVTFSLDFTSFDPNTVFSVDGISKWAEAPGASRPHDYPLDKKTAFLYNQFVTKNLTDYSHSAEDANDLQYTIWYIQGEIQGENRQGDWDAYSNTHTKAKEWYKLAKDATANSTSFYGVQVLNLNSINGNDKNKSKVDLNVLYASPLSEPNPAAPVPEPSTLLLMAAGFAGIGFYRRRKR